MLLSITLTDKIVASATPKNKMKEPELNIKTVAIDSIEYDPFNVREHDERNVDAIKASIARFGQQKPIVVKKDGTVIAGNGTLGAMRILGYKEVVIAETELDGEEAVAFSIADNRTAELATWDDQALAQALDQLDDELLPASGFDEAEMAELLERLEPSDIDSDAPEAQTDRADDLQDKWGVKRGDLWVIGNHRLLCGDATSAEDVARLMDEDSVDMVYTDPPYGVSVVKQGMVGADFGVAKKGRYAEVIGDGSTDAAHDAISLCVDIGIRALIVWGGNYFADRLPPTSCWLVWDKRVDSGIENTFADCELAWTNLGGQARIHRQLWNGMIREGEHDKRVHPTQKPVALASWAIHKFSKDGNIMDLFLGSGSTMVAAEQLNRRCFGMELGPKYCAVILERMADMGLEPRLDGSRDS